MREPGGLSHRWGCGARPVKGPKLVPVCLLAEVLKHRPQGDVDFACPCPRGSGCCGPGVGKLVLSLCRLWPSQVCVGITTSRLPRGLPAASTCSLVSCNFPRWCWPLVLEQQSWILGTEAWRRLEIRWRCADGEWP